MKITNLSILSLIIIGFSYQTSAASFDCTKAKSFAEKTICSDKELSNYDDVLSKVYDRAKNVVQNKKGFSNLTRELWNSREECSTHECVERWYDTAFVVYDTVIKTNFEKQSPQVSNGKENSINVERYECKDVRDGRLVLISDYGNRFEVFTKNAEHFKSGVVTLNSNGSKTGLDESGYKSYVVSPGSAYIINYGSGYSVGGIMCKERTD
ncbi:lysozyme inhibitor LprI family protein [Serratia sp. J2]|uniref:lysozyme inhibitor LprI family protein n=1 Tax=Serratia sp. J2 TaxID=3386551 RepID=UPI003916D1D3